MRKDIKVITRFIRDMQGTRRYKKVDFFSYEHKQRQLNEYETIKNKEEILK